MGKTDFFRIILKNLIAIIFSIGFEPFLKEVIYTTGKVIKSSPLILNLAISISILFLFLFINFLGR